MELEVLFLKEGGKKRRILQRRLRRCKEDARNVVKDSNIT
jgi:hypothetical protein